MKFPWNKYEEIQTCRKKTLQVFITNQCNLSCEGCFVRNIIGQNNFYMSVGEYERAIYYHKEKGGEKVNILGGEPLLHPHILKFIEINRYHNLPTTIYTNGYYLDRFSDEQLRGVKIRVSIYSYNSPPKSITGIRKTPIKFDVNFMVEKHTIVEELLLSANFASQVFNSDVFFISSIRELDNQRQEFFDDTDLTMPILKYKELVHDFLNQYDGDMEIHVSKRGVFESTLSQGFNQCVFANYFIGGKIVQCPYDIINKKFQEDYEYNKRYCQHNSSCMMTKVIYKRKR